MKKIFYQTILLALCCLAAEAQSVRKDTWVTFGGGVILPFDNVQVSGYTNPKFLSKPGSMSDASQHLPGGKIFADVPLGNTFGIHTSLSARKIFAQGSFNDSSSEQYGVQNGVVVKLKTSHGLETSLPIIFLDFLARMHLPLGIDAGLGPGIAFLFNNSSTLSDNVTTPAGGTFFENGSSSKVLANENNPSTSPLQLYASLRLSSQIALMNHFFIVPEMTVMVPTIAIDNAGTSGTVSSYAGSVSIGWQPWAGDAPVVEQPPPKIYVLDATLDIHSLDASGNRVSTTPIVIEEKQVIEKSIAKKVKLIYAPRLVIEPEIIADTTILEYGIKISSEGTTLMSFSDKNPARSLDSAMWKGVVEKIADSVTTLAVTLSVTDAIGQHIERVSSIPIERRAFSQKRKE